MPFNSIAFSHHTCAAFSEKPFYWVTMIFCVVVITISSQLENRWRQVCLIRIVVEVMCPCRVRRGIIPTGSIPAFLTHDKYQNVIKFYSVVWSFLWVERSWYGNCGMILHNILRSEYYTQGKQTRTNCP